MFNRILRYSLLIIGVVIIAALAVRFIWPTTVETVPAPGSKPVPTPTATSTFISSHAPSPAIASSSIKSPVPVSAPVITAATTSVSTSSPISKASSSIVIIQVPFTSQAPLGGWSDERQQDGCEEASAAMAMAWVNGEKNITKQEWLDRILAIADFEQKKYGENRDVALKDVVSWIFNDYFSYQKVSIKPVASSSDIIKELEKGNVVLIPTNGQALKNPNYKAPGPEEHMLVIKGYDYKKDEFITNDSGTRLGENYRYSSKTIFNAIRPYETGYKLPFPKILVREMIVVVK